MEEKCPKCGSPVVVVETKSGKKMKKCSTNTWNKETKQAEGCDFVEWQNGSTESLDEECPTCGEKLVLYTTANGKKMKKCSTSGWDKVKKVPTGCTYVEWLKADATPQKSANAPLEEDVPPDPSDIF
jgi:ssDNA-binding Zn-finger/Zn-ribbon topoisomerase 1